MTTHDLTDTSREYKTQNQYLVALFVNMLPIGFGMVAGWASPSIILLTSDDSPLVGGKITMEEASSVASFVPLGALFGNFLFGFITNKCGRKKILILLAIPAIISWMLILYAQNVLYLYASRLLSGIVGSGIFIIVPLFLAEISDIRNRGILGSTLVLSSNFGILLAFVFGHYFSFYAAPKFVIVLTSLFAIVMLFFPETPLTLVKHEKIADAEKSIRFYYSLRKNDANSKFIQMEINKLKCICDETKRQADGKSSLNWTDLMTPPGRRAMTIGIFVIVLNQCCGCFAMLNYTADIFKASGSSLSPNMSSIVVGVIQLLGAFLATYLVDWTGRKFLYAVSTIGTALGLVTLGIDMMLKSWHFRVDTFNWVPLAAFSMSIFMASWAILPLPFLLIAEVMPEKLKAFGMSFCMALMWLLAFTTTKFLPFLIDTLEFYGTMFLFSGVCLISMVFIVLVVPETKGISYEQIMNALR